jgi:PAS domain S-box-containing protein
MSKNLSHERSAKEELYASELLRTLIESLPSEERYRAVVEQTADGIFLIDGATKSILEANARFEELLGYGHGELHGMTLYDLVPHDREGARANVDRVLEQKSYQVGERSYRRKDGSLVDVEVSTSIIEHDNKEILWCVARDITERKRAEEKLRESEGRFRSAFEDSPIGVALVGLDRRHLRVNRAFCKMLGYSEEELLEKPHPEIVHPDDRDESSERLQQALEGGPESYTFERRYVHADGHVVWNLSSVSLVRDSRGKPSHLVCLHQDITERKELEERLEHRAFHDSLTDLPNRALFLNCLGHALAQTGREDGPVAVLLLDLNHFKMVNDPFGTRRG